MTFAEAAFWLSIISIFISVFTFIFTIKGTPERIRFEIREVRAAVDGKIIGKEPGLKDVPAVEFTVRNIWKQPIMIQNIYIYIDGKQQIIHEWHRVQSHNTYGGNFGNFTDRNLDGHTSIFIPFPLITNKNKVKIKIEVITELGKKFSKSQNWKVQSPPLIE